MGLLLTALTVHAEMRQSLCLSCCRHQSPSSTAPLAAAAIRYRARSACLTIAAGRRRDGFSFEDVDVTDGPLDRAITQQQVVISPAAVHVVVAEVELFDLRRGQRQAVRGPVPLDQLVLGYPVDLPRDGVQVPCRYRVEHPLPHSEHAPG